MTTPLRRQYLEIKRRFPRAIVFFRLGDFYETFDQDAEVVARELDVVLTSRNVSRTSACRWPACHTMPPSAISVA